MKREKSKVKDYDQFQLRLPPGMRDRIKEKAEFAGMSMNEAIVWCLEKTFPPKVTLEEKLEELANAVSMLKDSKDTYQGLDSLIERIDDTISDVIWNKVPTEPRFREMVQERHNYWQERLADEFAETHQSPFETDASNNDDDIPF
ncbi:Arc family DNA-binding protein [Neorhizobium sp. NPDC001467]|uniref:Arc family DNA-binding protein n=1 Tax=Neorhizobium sp. NPDC001467 TaxID=3390595 RepID=UPI003CFBF71D